MYHLKLYNRETLIVMSANVERICEEVQLRFYCFTSNLLMIFDCSCKVKMKPLFCEYDVVRFSKLSAVSVAMPGGVTSWNITIAIVVVAWFWFKRVNQQAIPND